MNERFGPNTFERLAQGSEARLAHIEAVRGITDDEILAINDPQTTLFSKIQESLRFFLRPVDRRVALPVSVILLIIAVACSSNPDSGINEPTVNKPSIETAGKIAFNSDREGNPEIYLMDQDGSNVTNVTDNHGLDAYQDDPWSPDGSKLLFMSDRNGNVDIFTINADGSDEMQITDHPEDDLWPIWSPNGEQIAFTTERDGNVEIYIVNADGSELRNLTNNQADEGALGFTWSPDGTRLAYSSNRELENQLYMIDINGENEKLVARGGNSEHILESHWSPDGGSIAFEMIQLMVGNDIFIVDIETNDFVHITDEIIDGANVRWSPDGSLLLFDHSSGFLASDRKIYVIGKDASNPVNLTGDAKWSGLASWSPDGDRIVFVTERDGNKEIYVMNADGSNPVRLTNNPAIDSLPAWSPAQ